MGFWVLLLKINVGSRLRTNIKLKCLFVNGQCQIFGGRATRRSPLRDGIPRPHGGTLFLRAFKGERERRTEASACAKAQALVSSLVLGDGGNGRGLGWESWSGLHPGCPQGTPLQEMRWPRPHQGGEPSPPRGTRGRLLGPLRGLCMTGLLAFESPSP